MRKSQVVSESAKFYNVIGILIHTTVKSSNFILESVVFMTYNSLKYIYTST